ncbi:cytosine permease [Escherichia coli]|nr:cytosine permease [Escherichia coli]
MNRMRRIFLGFKQQKGGISCRKITTLARGQSRQSARKGVLALTFVMLGLTFFSASMWTGGTLGTGLSYHDFFLAVLIGNLLLGIYTSFLGYIGAKTGLTTHLLARFSFGVKGSWLPSLLLGGTQVGWFGVGVAMFAIPVGKATGLDINLLIAVSRFTDDRHRLFWHFGADGSFGDCGSGYRLPGRLFRVAGC